MYFLVFNFWLLDFQVLGFLVFGFLVFEFKDTCDYTSTPKYVLDLSKGY